MIKVENLSFSFPNKDLYEDVSFAIEDGQSCAFIGSSGSGKSTLAEILIDPERYVIDGKVIKAENLKISYVSQFYDVDRTRKISVFDYIAEEILALHDNIEAICTEMETAEDFDTLLERYQAALDEYEAIDGDNYESNISKKLSLAGLLSKKDLDISLLSGGEYKLVQVIKQMLINRDFIIMDEPDSFLDFDNLKALKDLINAHKGTMLTITHSRYLLNHCFNKILHLENCEIQEFDGSYIDYNFALLENKVEMQEKAYADTMEIERNDILIERLRKYATEVDSPANGRALYARVRLQERLVARRVNNPFINIAEPAIDFLYDGDVEEEEVLNVEDFSVSFDELLFENVSFSMNKGDKVAIIGANGAGKTTLLRSIINSKSDKISINESAKLAYLTQGLNETLAEDRLIVDEFFDAGFDSYEDIVEYLDSYGFPVDKLNQKIGKLSGGEKNILGLAKVAKQQSNLLILDEPTSHLDTYAQIALEKALNRYEGAILMISHDFYAIVNCMDYVLIIEDKTLRKMRMRKFRKTIYAQHFSKDYLELEQAKKALEVKVEAALNNNNFTTAKEALADLEKIVIEMRG